MVPQELGIDFVMGPGLLDGFQSKVVCRRLRRPGETLVSCGVLGLFSPRNRPEVADEFAVTGEGGVNRMARSHSRQLAAHRVARDSTLREDSS